VLDLTGAWIGPYAAMLLADLGAEVIKIESPRRPDVWRIFRPAANGKPELPPGTNPRAHPWNTSFYYNAVNRNKRGIALDLASQDGREIFLTLVAGADIVMENFTPRVLENFGLGYEALRRVRPDLIVASFSGYGATGPYRDYKANGATIETIAGWTALFGYPDEPPMSLGEMEADPLSGLQMAALTLVALEHRAQTGEGQRIDGAMFEAATGYIGEELLRAGLSDEPPARLGNGDRAFGPQGVFPCTGNDHWIAISVRDDADWRALVTVAADAPALHEPRFASHVGRRAAAREVEAALAEWTSRHDARDLMRRLQAVGVPAGVVLKTDEVPADPQFIARSWFRPLAHPDLGERLYGGHPWRFSRSPLVWRLPPPRVGEHSAELLSALLAIDGVAYAALVEQGVSGSVLEWPEPVAAETA
jgi:crotonobetainyl-CoA:carnitine CoA-transferase CaiB-like acyl-CoA transferase